MTYLTKGTFSGLSTLLKVVTRTNVYSCVGCVLHKLAIPKRGTVHIIRIDLYMCYDRLVAEGSKVSCSYRTRYHPSFLTEK